MNNVIEIKNVSKKYDDKFQLGSIDLSIPSGYIIGLIGENGAGKTTLIKTILNIIKQDKGSIKIFHKDMKEQEEIIKEDIGVVLDNMFFPEVLTPNDINIIMKDVYKNWDEEVFHDYLKKWNLPKEKSLKTMSKGMRKKIEIITALSHKPKLLILDEPTSGLDPVARNDILDVFLNFIQDEEHTILLSTHITTDLEHIADKIIFINNGKIILQETKDELLDNYGILKCEEDKFHRIEKNDIIRYQKNKYHYTILMKDRAKMKKKYKDEIIDKLTLEELMLLMIKGEKTC